MPKQVWIGPLRWKIKCSDKAYHAVQSLSEEHAIGFTSVDSLTISIKPGLPRSLERETLLHEILHALYGTQGGVFKVTKRSELEEASVCALSPMLMGTLRDNPTLVSYLLEVCDESC
jgi:hypothetical protein